MYVILPMCLFCGVSNIFAPGTTWNVLDFDFYIKITSIYLEKNLSFSLKPHLKIKTII